MSEYVRLESDDGFSFVVARKTAMASGTLRAMLDQDGASMLLPSGLIRHSGTPRGIATMMANLRSCFRGG